MTTTLDIADENKIRCFRQSHIEDKDIDNTVLLVRALMSGLIIEVNGTRLMLNDDCDICQIGYSYVGGVPFSEVLLPTKHTFEGLIRMGKALTVKDESKMAIELGWNIK